MKKIFTAVFLLAACSSTPTTPPITSAPENIPMKAIRLELKDPPLIGTTPAGQRLYLGGFSGLRYLGKNKAGNLRFLTLTDRGPNADEFEENGKTRRPFLLPGFQPRIVFLEANVAAGTLKIEREIPLRRPDGKKLSGIPQQAGQEDPLDSTGKAIALDPYGMDLEGIVQNADGSFWMVEEYGPTVAKFSADGKMVETLKPGKGLPTVLGQRRLNRGFEGSAIMGNRLYAVIQSPLDNPRSENSANSKKSSVVRIVEVDLTGKRTLAQFAYVLDDPSNRIGDLAVAGPRTLLVVEQDGKGGKKSAKRIYQVNLESSTNLQLSSERIAGPGGSLEGMDAYAMEAAKITPAKKVKFLDLASQGIIEEKVEGVDAIDDDTIAVVIDNDFGLAGDLDRQNGLAEFKDEPSVIYLLRSPVWVPAK